MKDLISVLILILFFSVSFAQKIVNIDFNYVKEETTKKNSDNYYEKLLDRYNKYDTTFTEEEYMFLYYGFTFRPEYNPYGISKEEEKFFDAYHAGNYKKAIPLGQSVLAKNPVHLNILFKMAVCYYALNEVDMFKFYISIYKGLLSAVYRSGDGMSIETAWVVNSVSDEYEILRNLKLSMVSQTLLEGPTDMFSLDTENQEYDPPVEKLYFNVAKPFERMSKIFK